MKSRRSLAKGRQRPLPKDVCAQDECAHDKRVHAIHTTSHKSDESVAHCSFSVVLQTSNRDPSQYYHGFGCIRKSPALPDSLDSLGFNRHTPKVLRGNESSKAGKEAYNLRSVCTKSQVHLVKGSSESVEHVSSSPLERSLAALAEEH